MQIFFISALLGAVFVVETSATQPVDELWLRILLTALTCATVIAFAIFGTLWLLRRQHPRACQIERLKRFHAWVWIAASGAILCSFQWPAIVRYNLGLDRLILIDELVIYLPVVLPLLGSWAAFSELHGRANSSRRRRVDFVVHHARMYLAIVLIPLFAVFVVEDLIRLCSLDLGIRGVGHVLTVSALLVFLPWFLKGAWDAERLPGGRLRGRLESISDAQNLRCRDFLLWKTNQRMVTAVVVGVFGPFRYVFLSDGLLKQFSNDEIEAVLLHEAGHVKRGHLWWRVLVALPPLLVSLLVWRASGNVLAVGLGVAGLIGLSAFVLGWYSKRQEHDADLWAVRQLALRPKLNEKSAIDLYIGVLENLRASNGLGHDQETWLHPSIARRVAVLRACSFA